jgi:hypothetical protein
MVETMGCSWCFSTSGQGIRVTPQRTDWAAGCHATGNLLDKPMASRAVTPKEPGCVGTGPLGCCGGPGFVAGVHTVLEQLPNEFRS